MRMLAESSRALFPVFRTLMRSLELRLRTTRSSRSTSINESPNARLRLRSSVPLNPFKLANSDKVAILYIMKNKLALKLVAAANKYRDHERYLEDSEKVVQEDYEDLISIANMIESNETDSQIQTAMWKLDTLVRDVIPDDVYYAFNK